MLVFYEHLDWDERLFDHVCFLNRMEIL